jgi:hypothetical protein
MRWRRFKSRAVPTDRVVRLNVHAFNSRSASTHSDYALLIADSLRATVPFHITR